MKKFILFLVILTLALPGCASPEAAAPPVNTELPPTATSASPTSTPILPTFIAIPPTSTSAPPAPTLKPAPSKRGKINMWKVQVGDLVRTYVYYLPVNMPQNPPLLLAFHGYASTGDDMRTTSTGNEFEKLAEKFGFVVVYPNGYERSWNDCRKLIDYRVKGQNIDDVAFVHALIEKFKTDFGIDSGRVFAAGFSNGGLLAYRLALELPEEIAAIAVVAVSLPVEDDNICQPAGKPIPVLIMNGTGDPIVPYEGGIDGLFGAANSPLLSTEATAKYFVQLNGLTNPPTTTRLPHLNESDPTTVDRIVWSEPGKPEVVLVRINGGGHVLPQSKFPKLGGYGAVAGDIDGPEEIWDFFAKQQARK